MKKTLSIMLIITILFSIVSAAVPVGATEEQNVISSGQTAGNSITVPDLPEKGVTDLATGAEAVTEPTEPTYTEATLGNYIGKKSEAEMPAYLATINAELREDLDDDTAEYIPIVNTQAKVDELAAKDITAVLYTAIEDGKYYCLWEDITWSAAQGNRAGRINIDGAGHSLKMNSQFLFTHIKAGITLKNITITRDDAVPANNKQLHVLAQWDMFGAITVENVTLDVDYNVTANTHTSDGLGVLSYALQTDSSLNNVLNTSTINVNSGVVRMQQIAGLVSYTEGTVTINGVVNRGTININGATLTTLGGSGQSACAAIGGIVGTVSGGTKMTNCFNEMNINVKHGSVLGTGVPIGGIVGKAAAGATFENCVNSGNIVIGESDKETFTPKVTGIGGIVGNAANGTVKITSCFNKGSFEIKNGVVLDNINIGGIVAEAPSGMTFFGCVNSGNITVGEGKSTEFDPKIKSVGGITGAVVGNAVINSDINSPQNTYTFDTCFNEGEIYIQSDVKVTVVSNVDIYQGVAGIVGCISGTTALKNCVNAADIVSDAKLLRCFAGIVGAGQGTAVAFNNCINGVAGSENGVAGDIKIFQNGNTISDAASAGGILGYQYKAGASRVAIYNCTNNGDIVDTTNTTDRVTTTTDKLFRGGIAAVVRGVKDVTFYNCVNNGDVLAGAITQGASSSGGIIARYGSVGNWMGNKTVDSTLTVERCTNTGRITSNVVAGGIFGETMEIADADKKGIVHNLRFEQCLNTGTVERLKDTGSVGCAGIASTISGDISKLSVEFINCENRGTITTKNNCAGGIAGNIIGSDTYAARVYFSDCENTGDIRSEKDNVGGISACVTGVATDTASIDTVNDYVPGLTLLGCVNNNSVTGRGSVGGIIGSVQAKDGTTTTVSKCYNGSNGTIVLSGESTSGVGAGGIVGSLFGISSATVSYCENQGALALADNTKGNNRYFGGVIGCVGGDNPSVELNYCVNDGAVGGSTYSAGMIGRISTTNESRNYSFLIKNSVNNGKVTSNNAAGMLAYCSAKGTENTVAVGIKDCVNSGDITATTAGAGIVTGHGSGAALTYTVEKCVVIGAVSGNVSAGIATSVSAMSNSSSISGCIVGGSLVAQGGNSAYDFAPEGVTPESCQRITDAAALENALDTIVSSDGTVTGVLAYKRANIKALYASAARIADSTVYGDRSAEFIAARNAAKTCAVFEGASEAYFPITQTGVDNAYDTLYGIMYGYDPASFSVYIPEAITLESDETITASIENFTIVSQLKINVRGDFELHRDGELEEDYYLKYYLVTADGTELRDDGTLFVIDENSNADDEYGFKALVDIDNSKVVPGEYKGSLTFEVEYVKKPKS